MPKEIAVPPHNGMPLGHERKRTVSTRDSPNGPQENCPEHKKPISKGGILHDMIYTTFSK